MLDTAIGESGDLSTRRHINDTAGNLLAASVLTLQSVSEGGGSKTFIFTQPLAQKILRIPSERRLGDQLGRFGSSNGVAYGLEELIFVGNAKLLGDAEEQI